MPSTTVRSLFYVGVCAHSRSDDLRQRVFDDETVPVWRSMLHDDYPHVRREALNVLGLAMNHSMLSPCVSLCSDSGTGDLRELMFDTPTVSVWRSMLHDHACYVRQEALKVLGLAISHSMLTLLCWCLLTAGQVAFVNSCLTLRLYPCGVVCSKTMAGLSDKKP